MNKPAAKNGVLVIDKPAGPTSHDIVAEIRHMIRQQEIGHTGTLDPMATGVLPLVLGRATKVAKYLTGGDKAYRATIRLGITTSTLDSAGDIVEQKAVNVSEDVVKSVVGSFVGRIAQIPPMFSAKKQQGKRLYELARQGIEVAREPKDVIIHTIHIVSINLPDIVIEVSCSAGTYVRVLAADIGQKLGCGAHLYSLQRTAAGPFTLEHAVTLDRLKEEPTAIDKWILPVDRALSGLPQIRVPTNIGKMIASGYQLSVADLRNLDLPDLSAEQVLTLALDNGQLIAVARSLLSSADLEAARRDRQAVKTERVLVDLRHA